MNYRTFGRTGIRISEIGFGAWAIGGVGTLGGQQIGWGKVDDQESLRAIQTCLDVGINLFDTANTYGAGHSEELLGQALAGKRDQVVIVSKYGNVTTPDDVWTKDFSAAEAMRAIEASLRRLRTDYLDVYLAHTPRPPEMPLPDDWWTVLDKLKAQGKTRHYGVSIGPVSHGVALIEEGRADVLQVVYNLLVREPEAKLLPEAARRNIGIMARVPLASGLLTGKYEPGHTFAEDDHRGAMGRDQLDAQVRKAQALAFLADGTGRTMAQAALKFCLMDPAVSVVIPGAKTPQQVRDNAAASDAPDISDAEMERIGAVAAKA